MTSPLPEHEPPPQPPERPRLWRGLLQTLVALIALAFAFTLGLQLGGDDAAPGAHGHAEDEAGRWTCSMHPQIQQDQPGACPICGMDLIPVKQPGAGADLSDARVQLSERAMRQARIRTSAVQRAPSAAPVLHLPGRLDLDETGLRSVTSWIDGRIDRLHVTTTGQTLRRGQPIATLYSPEVYTAHQDLITSRRQLQRLQNENAQPFAISAAQDAINAVHKRLALLGIPEAEIDAMRAEDTPRRQITIRSTAAGTVLERLVTEGAWVKAGTPLYRTGDLSRLWLQIDAWERDLPLLLLGQEVDVTLEALPGQTLTGTVAFIDPILNLKTRTARVRVALPNPDGHLKPGMFAEATLRAADPNAAPSLTIPATAPLFSGRRSIVYVEIPGADLPTFEAREVRLAPRSGDVYPVIAGLQEGERVVTEGAFRLDADLQIRGGRAMMTRDDDTAALPPSLPEPDRASLALIVLPYLDLQRALADDDLPAAQRAAQQLDARAHDLTALSPQATAEARDAWPPLRLLLLQHAQALQRAASLAEARVPFEPLSAQLALLLRTFGNPTPHDLHVAFCPMAFDNRGARWVQQGTTVQNAYFGHQMLRCGEVEEALPEPHPAAVMQDAPAPPPIAPKPSKPRLIDDLTPPRKPVQAPTSAPTAPPTTQPDSAPQSQPATHPMNHDH